MFNSRIILLKTYLYLSFKRKCYFYIKIFLIEYNIMSILGIVLFASDILE